MRIANTVHDSIVDGQGLRFTVFTQGCPHRCPGCHNPGTHDPAGGRDVSVAALVEELTKNPLMAGLTLSGGEPFAQAADCAALAKAAHGLGLTVWTYTGYLFEHFRGSRNQRLIDVAASLVQGKPVLWQEEDPLAKFTVPES